MKWPDDQDDQGPAGVDPTVPTAARIYDYLLGGSANYPADRAAAEQAIAAYPHLPVLDAVPGGSYLVLSRRASLSSRWLRQIRL